MKEYIKSVILLQSKRVKQQILVKRESGKEKSFVKSHLENGVESMKAKVEERNNQ